MLIALLLPGWAAALDYRSLATATTLYDAPSQKAKPVFVIAAGTPVEVVVVLDTWLKVRDMKGELAWIERRHLSEKRMVQVRQARAQIRANPEATAPLVFEADPDVLLEGLESVPGGWIRVRHRDGQQGFVKATQVWGF